MRSEESLCIGPWGSSEEGEPWDYQPRGHITLIVIRHGACIDSLKFLCDCTSERKFQQAFGGVGGNITDTIGIDGPMEYLTDLNITIGSFNKQSVVTSICFQTNMAIHGPFGSLTGTHFFIPIKDGSIVGFHGRAGKYLNALGIYAKAQSSLRKYEKAEIVPTPTVPREHRLWGAEVGHPWDDGVYLFVKKICIQVVEVSLMTDVLSSVQFLYEKRDGDLVWSPVYGGQGDNTNDPVTIDLSRNILVGIEGFYGDGLKSGYEFITSLTFHTYSEKYGPFGTEIGTFFSSNLSGGEVVGFFGRSGDFLNAIGLHMDYN